MLYVTDANEPPSLPQRPAMLQLHGDCADAPLAESKLAVSLNSKVRKGILYSANNAVIVRQACRVTTPKRLVPALAYRNARQASVSVDPL